MKPLFFWVRLYKHFLINFYQRPVYRDLADRKGKCNRCGYCCKEAKCPLLIFDKDGKPACKVHGDPAYPWQCAIFPLRMDIKAKKTGKNCGYFYPKKNQ